MAYSSNLGPSAQHLSNLATPSISGHSTNQTSMLRRREPDNHKKKGRQMTGHGASNSVPDSEADSDVSLRERNAASEATNSTVITSEDLERICREYEEQVNETYRQVTQRVKNSVPNLQQKNESSTSGDRSSRTKQIAPQSGTEKRQRKRPREEHDDTSSGELERPSSFLASVRAWRKDEGKRSLDEFYFQVARLSDARQSKSGDIEIKTHWVPIWVPIENLRGEESYDEAKELVVGKFGEDVWTEASDGWDAMEPYMEDDISYATE